MLSFVMLSDIMLSVVMPWQVFQISMKNVVLLSGRLRSQSLVSYNLANDKCSSLIDRTLSDEETSY